MKLKESETGWEFEVDDNLITAEVTLRFILGKDKHSSTIHALAGQGVFVCDHRELTQMPSRLEGEFTKQLLDMVCKFRGWDPGRSVAKVQDVALLNGDGEPIKDVVEQ